MDPDECLKQIRQIAQRIQRNSDERVDNTIDGSIRDVIRDDGDALAERVLALDNWIKGGGFLPKEWHYNEFAKALKKKGDKP